MVLWQVLRRFDWAKRVENGYEFLVLLPVLFLGAVAAVYVAEPVEAMLFDGNFKQWLFTVTETPYDPLNSMVVAFGLGFAVIPIIFSISEDSLSDIPYDLTAASLALGASRWQTVWRVILPSASPGIFAAAMIGFGRAVGETMIVFMATGNTPILDWNPFNGFRTLAANIAVEISEAPRDGTLYRVLFLCAVLLFMLTFLLNTAAELVRHHLRKKYGRY
jgi:phosphate transport system permease protein